MTGPGAGAGRTPLGSLLNLDTAQVSLGRFQLELDETWTVMHVHGGVLVALAARMAEHGRADDTMCVTGVSATFLRPVAAGPVEGVVTWLRAGRRAAQASVDLVGPDGELAVRVAVVLASLRGDDAGAVARASPAGALDVDGSIGLGPVVAESADLMPFQQQHTWRLATPGQLRQRSAEGPRRSFDSWFRLHETPRTADGHVEPLVACLAADTIGLAATESLGLWKSDRRFVLPTLSMDVQIIGCPVSSWLLQHAEIHHLGHGMVLGTVHLFDEDGRLVAHTSQRATVRFY